MAVTMIMPTKNFSRAMANGLFCFLCLVACSDFDQLQHGFFFLAVCLSLVAVDKVLAKVAY